jgi:hypothetical protein
VVSFHSPHVSSATDRKPLRDEFQAALAEAAG